jgi:hypothetical protein
MACRRPTSASRCSKGNSSTRCGAQLAEKDARIEVLERLLAQRDTRLVERDDEITRLRRRLRALVDVEV